MNSLILKQKNESPGKKGDFKKFSSNFYGTVALNATKDFHGVQQHYWQPRWRTLRWQTQKKSSASNESIHELTDNQKVGLQYVSGHVLQNLHKNIVKLTLLKANKPWPSLKLENWTA